MSRVSCAGCIMGCVLLALGTQAAWPATYVSTDVPQTGNPISSRIAVPDNLMVEKATVTIDNLEALESIAYLGSTSGISVELQSPNNSNAGLLGYSGRTCYEGNPCQYEHSYHNLTFDDAIWGYPGIDGFTNPALDSSVPSWGDALSVFQSENSGGTWTLRVSMPNAPLSLATLTGWHLTIEGCEQNPEGCPQPVFDGVYEMGRELCLCVPCPVSTTSTFAWAKDSEPLTDDGRILGANARTLHITSLDIGDAGVYSCTYDDGAMAPSVYEKTIQVVTRVPAVGPLGMVLLTTICGALVVILRRGRV